MTDANAAAEAAALALPSLARPCPAWPSQAEPCSAEEQRYHKKLARVLDVMGGLYTVDDLLTRIYDGRMQSFAVGNSWAITQIEQYPRASQLNVLAIIGDLPDVPALNDQVLDFARRIGVGLVSTNGRRGWLEHGHALGWKLKSRSFLWKKEL
jgi:hypothetical protein